MERMIKSLNSLFEVPSLNNAQNVSIGLREYKDVVQWVADADISFVMIVEEVIVHMGCVKI